MLTFFLMHQSLTIPWGTLGRGGDFVKNLLKAAISPIYTRINNNQSVDMIAI